jgi:hypothetical protein
VILGSTSASVLPSFSRGLACNESHCSQINYARWAMANGRHGL